MKIFGIPIIYIVIAVGVLGIVTYSYVSYNKPAFIADDTLKCQRTYDFSQVQFTAEAKQDWDKCYFSEPSSIRRENGRLDCLDNAQMSCLICAETIAQKYNDSNYCDLIKACGQTKEVVQYYFNKCVYFVHPVANTEICTIPHFYWDANYTEITNRYHLIYPDVNKRTDEIQDKYCTH